MSHFFCTERTEKSQTPTTKATEQADSTLSGDFATAQIALNIETLSDNTLAYATLDIIAVKNDKGKYKIKTLLVDDGEKGPFSSLNIVDKVIFTKNGAIKVLITYELETQRITWATEKGKLTGAFGDTAFKESIKSEGGLLSCTATLVFDEKSMRLLSQSSMMNEKVNSQTKNESDFEQWHDFASKYLKTRLVSQINWTNANCKDNNCKTGEIREGK